MLEESLLSQAEMHPIQAIHIDMELETHGMNQDLFVV
jgi:hypothetical protein